ncbi:hypothetical protein [Cellulomonas alba]|uniref:HTH cro/C1-type domain-containing protein n=1 Tax=Cellulomonas alba TaxID=3053467 RepID=A0ABT7SIH9_9CELL|nr:hypothetical protein [Cellulomonas alba]MDM7855984.1 hypothetical protein [Cellulomonas alba]
MQITKKRVLVTSAAAAVALVSAVALSAATDASASAGGQQAAATAQKTPDRPPHQAATVKTDAASAQDVDALTLPSTIRQLAQSLGVSQDAASTAAAGLRASEHGDGLDPRSAEFAAVADQLGVSTSDLVGAINTIKSEG